MSYDVDIVRTGVSQAEITNSASDKLYSEIIFFAISMGFFFGSWYLFGGLLVGLIVAIHLPILRIIVLVFFAILWGAIGAYIGFKTMHQDAAIVLGIIGLILGAITHMNALVWLDDMRR